MCNAKLKNWTERREGEDWQQNWEQSCLQITEHVHFYPSSTVHNEEKKQLCVLSADSASADKSDEFPGAVSSYLRPTLALVFPPRLESS